MRDIDSHVSGLDLLFLEDLRDIIDITDRNASAVDRFNPFGCRLLAEYFLKYRND